MRPYLENIQAHFAYIYKRNTKSQSSNQPFRNNNNNNKPYKNCRRKYRTDNNETENKHGTSLMVQG